MFDFFGCAGPTSAVSALPAPVPLPATPPRHQALPASAKSALSHSSSFPIHQSRSRRPHLDESSFADDLAASTEPLAVGDYVTDVRAHDEARDAGAGITLSPNAFFRSASEALTDDESPSSHNVHARTNKRTARARSGSPGITPARRTVIAPAPPTGVQPPKDTVVHPSVVQAAVSRKLQDTMPIDHTRVSLTDNTSLTHST